MTTVRFYKSDNAICGFNIIGHSSESCSDFNGKLVCAAVSSAAYMTVNTLTEVIGAKVSAKISEAQMKVLLISGIEKSQPILKGFRIHIEQLSQQYESNLKIISEV
ncbi:MAG: ribosomal-processing cysteine protease Prp [bacterium]|nr:ribosomal-processing cysteine protease Prp [bacterium]